MRVSDEAIAQIADSLLALARRLYPRGTVRDVFGWRRGDGDLGFAFNGPARSLMAMSFTEDRYLRNRDHSIDRIVEKEFGINEQCFSDGQLSLYEWLNGLERAISAFFNHDPDTSRVTILPEPGYPYNGHPTPYYSAARGRWLVGDEPSWATTVPHPSNPSQRIRAARWCDLAPVRSAAQSGYGRMEIGKRSFIATHSFDRMNSGKHDEETAASIHRCGGLLFPSIAIGEIPAPSFLPGVLVLDPVVVLENLKPYRPARVPQRMVVYSSDAWTDVVSSLNERTADLYNELTGNTSSDDYAYGTPQLNVLGPSLSEDGDHVRGIQQIPNVSKMATALKSRAVKWKRNISERQMSILLSRSSTEMRSKDNYPFLEAKSSAVIPLADVVIAYVPDFDADRYAAHLRRAGYEGDIRIVRTTEEEADEFSGRSHSGAEHNDYVRYRYAWKVADLATADLRPMFPRTR